MEEPHFECLHSKCELLTIFRIDTYSSARCRISSSRYLWDEEVRQSCCRWRKNKRTHQGILVSSFSKKWKRSRRWLGLQGLQESVQVLVECVCGFRRGGRYVCSLQGVLQVIERLSGLAGCGLVGRRGCGWCGHGCSPFIKTSIKAGCVRGMFCM